jgi:16S rRNA processing protein RimM
MFKRYLEAGQIVNTHGLNGEVRVLSWGDTSDFLTQFDGFYFSEGTEYTKVKITSTNKGSAIMKVDGVNDINGAVKLVHKLIYIDREWVKLPEEAHFEQDLIGLRVEDVDTGHVYGVLREVAKTGANDIYNVVDGKQEVWIPAIKDVIKSVDIEGGKMLIKPLKGLFDDED